MKPDIWTIIALSIGQSCWAIPGPCDEWTFARAGVVVLSIALLALQGIRIYLYLASREAAPSN